MWRSFRLRQVGTCGGAAGTGDWLGLRRFGRGRHGWIPVKEPAATVAGEQLALAKLVPDLRAYAHAAAGALLIIGARDGQCHASGESVEAREPSGSMSGRSFAVVRRVRQAQRSVPFGGERRGPAAFKLCGRRLHLGSKLGERSFLSFRALKAGEFFVFEAVGFSGCELDFMLDGLGLFRRFNGVELGAKRAAFWRCVPVSRSRRVRRASSRLRASEASAARRSAAVSAA